MVVGDKTGTVSIQQVFQQSYVQSCVIELTGHIFYIVKV